MHYRRIIPKYRQRRKIYGYMEKKKAIIQNLLSYLFLLIKTGMVLGLLLYFICGWPSIRPIYAQSQKNFEIQANEDGSLQGYRIDADGQRAP